jgi:hypothetical protein
MAQSMQFRGGDVISFGGNATLRWSCRENDVVGLMRLPGLFAQSWDMLDFWQCRDGDYLTITNRIEDLPSWFELHPTEIKGRYLYQFKPESGRAYADPVESPNIWRIYAGDRVLWVGEERPLQSSSEGILAIVEFKENALLVRETNRDVDYMEWASGGPKVEPVPNMSLVKKAVKVIQSLGEPRSLSVSGWGLGS